MPQDGIWCSTGQLLLGCVVASDKLLALAAEGVDEGSEAFAKGGEGEAPEEHGYSEALDEEAPGRAEGQGDSSADRGAKDRRCKQSDSP